MNVVPVIRARLLAFGGVSALVSDRIYANYIPQTPTYPLIRLQDISRPDATPGSAELFTPRVQVDCFGASAASANALADAVIGGLREWGNLAATPPVLQTRDIDRRADYDPDTTTHREIVDFFVWIYD